MKRKLILAILMMSLSLYAGARVYVGGNIGLASESGSDRIGIVIAPEIGYRLNPHLTVGATVSYRSLQNTFGFIPYLRGDLINIHNAIRVFISAQAPCRFASGTQSFSAVVRPGFSVRVSNGVWLMAHIGSFGYSYTRSNGTGSGGWYAQVNSNTVNLGFCFDL